MATAGEKFLKSLKLREWASIETRTGMGMNELTGEGAPTAILTACLLTVAKQRQGPGFKFDDAEEMDFEQAGTEFAAAVEALGYVDDEDEDENLTEPEAA